MRSIIDYFYLDRKAKEVIEEMREEVKERNHIVRRFVVYQRWRKWI